LGILTRELLEAGAEVHAVELDSRLCAHLTGSLDFPGQFFLIHGDAVRFPIADLDATKMPYKVVANLPYAITTPWLDALLTRPLPISMTLLLQRESAERLFAQECSKRRSAITVRLASVFSMHSSYSVPSQCFIPRPRVESVLVHLHRVGRPFLFSAPARAILRHAFNYRRKQLRNVLATLPNPEWRDRAEHWFQNLHVDPRTRAEDLSVGQWQAIDGESVE
jgi:16S rRNA (adenine1518-N6/adenine1519-N6)-dimethyltransferase